MRVGFAGAGKVGFALGRYLHEQGICIQGFFSRTHSHAQHAAALTSSTAYETLPALCRDCDVVLLTVSDGVIAELAHGIAASGIDLTGKTACHLSGSLPSAVLAPARDAGAAVCSAHPLAAFSDELMPTAPLAGAFFTLEGDAPAVHALEALLDRCGNPHRAIDPAAKTAYHAAAVFLSNLVVGLADEGYRILERCGFTAREARAATASLFTRNAQAIAEHGPNAALTGPIERGDARTVARHLDALHALAAAQPGAGSPAADARRAPGPRGPDARTVRIYAELSQALCDLAADNHPDRDYADIRTILGKESQ